MELRQIKYFRLVSELGSFTRAADELGISQPSLSKQIRLLESELAAALLVRDGRGVKLTAAGAEFYDYAVEVDEKLQYARRSVAQLSSGTRKISIGATVLVGDDFLAELINQTRAKTAFQEIRLVEGYSQQIAAWLNSGRLDVALFYGAKPSAQAEITAQVSQDLYLITSASGSEPKEDNLTLSALEGIPLIAFDQPSRLRSLFENCAQKAGINLTFVHSIDSLPVIKAMIARSDSAIGLPYSAVADGIEKCTLRARKIDQEGLELVLQVVASRRSGVGREVYEVCALIRELLEQRCKSLKWQGSRLLPD